MSDRKVLLYYAWSRPGEIGAPLYDIDNRFPAVFELRRMQYPKLEGLADQSRFDQGIGGFLDHIMKENFAAFVTQTAEQTGHRPVEIERVGDDGKTHALDETLLADIDTLIVISFDSFRTEQQASADELAALRSFLSNPDHLVFICPHHDIGYVENVAPDQLAKLQEEDFHHHGDPSIPPQQRFGGFARSLLNGLGIPVENRFGLHPAKTADGQPAPIEAARERDRLKILDGVETFNLHAHLPQLERVGDATSKLEVLARQPIDLSAPPHEYVRSGHTTFDALLQTQPGLFAGALFVSDTTLWSSTAGGVENLRRLWSNVVLREKRG